MIPLYPLAERESRRVVAVAAAAAVDKRFVDNGER